MSSDGNLIASGGCDGIIRLINANNGKVISTFECTTVTKHVDVNAQLDNDINADYNDQEEGDVPPPAEDDIEIEENDDFEDPEDDDDDVDEEVEDKKPSCSVEGLAFCPNKPLLASVTAGGNVEIWDTNSLAKRVTCDIGGVGACRLLWHKSSSTLLAPCLDGVLREIDARSGEITAAYYGHEAELLSLSAASASQPSSTQQNGTTGGLVAVTASQDGTCRVFKIKHT